MSYDYKVATIFGGTGFIGRQVVRLLAKQGVSIKVATRVPERAYFLRPSGTVGQIVPFACDYNDPKSIAAAVEGADYVVNCIGILREKKKGQFDAVHTELPKAIAKACEKAGVERFVHVSALGADKATSRYAASKLAGEKAIQKYYPQATILRPSVVFGEDDEFFNMFARLAMVLPVLPLIGGGQTKFQPVYVGDVAQAVMAGLVNPAVGDQDPQAKIYELGGPEIFSFKEIYEHLFRFTGRKRALMPLPWGLAKFQACLMGVLPRPPLTPDQVESLKTDNVVCDTALGLEHLGVQSTAMDIILPDYLTCYRAGGRFADKASA